MKLRPRPSSVLRPLLSGLGLLAAALLAGCVDSPPWGGIGTRPTTGQVYAALAQQDSYVYFPGYEIYFNRRVSEYIYWDGRAWVSGIEPPRGIPTDMLLEAPSVAMRFQDSPARHHAQVVREFPRNWGRPGPVMVTTR